jgi:hypothetical protein
MRYLKYFEDLNKIQQPFMLINDTLFISDEIAHKMTPTLEELNKKGYREGWSEYTCKNNKNFYGNIKDENGYYISNHVVTDISVVYNGIFKMDLSIYRGNERDNEFGHFEYYIGGNSGDHYMHGKNMVRATRDCNIHLMEKLYPIVKNIKNFYKRLKNKEGFFDIIRDEILKNPEVAKDGIPPELEEEFGHISASYKYNL